MKRFLITAAALALLGAPTAFAQQQTQDQHDHKGTGGQGAHGSGGQGAQGAHAATGAAAVTGSPHVNAATTATPGSTPAGNGQRNWNGVAGGQVSITQTPSGQGQSYHAAASSGGGQTQSHGSQPTGNPDYSAYVKNNPDLLRAYKQNEQNPANHESVEAFGARHYKEAGKAEGRTLPTLQGGGYPSQGSNANSSQGRGGSAYQGRSGGQDSGRYRSFQRNTNSQHRYRAGEFHWPRGLGYHRYSFGEFLPQIFFGQDYWLYDYGDYSLPYPPPGTAWVRYGPDALLIDRYSGEVVEVVYGVFY